MMLVRLHKHYLPEIPAFPSLLFLFELLSLYTKLEYKSSIAIPVLDNQHVQQYFAA